MRKCLSRHQTFSALRAQDASFTNCAAHIHLTRSPSVFSTGPPFLCCPFDTPSFDI